MLRLEPPFLGSFVSLLVLPWTAPLSLFASSQRPYVVHLRQLTSSQATALHFLEPSHTSIFRIITLGLSWHDFHWKSLSLISPLTHQTPHSLKPHLYHYLSANALVFPRIAQKCHITFSISSSHTPVTFSHSSHPSHNSSHHHIIHHITT